MPLNSCSRLSDWVGKSSACLGKKGEAVQIRGTVDLVLQNYKKTSQIIVCGNLHTLDALLYCPAIGFLACLPALGLVHSPVT